MALKTGEPLSSAAQKLMQLEDKYSVGGFAPTPGFLVSGKGSTLMDVDGKEIIDFVTMFSATNIGHGHLKLIEAVVDCMRNATLINMSTYFAGWLELAKELCERFGYDKVTAMVSGAEAADTACKIARKWGITHRKIPAEEVIVLGTSDNYHGLTSGIWPIMNPGNQAGYDAFNKNLTDRHPRTGELLRYGYVEDFDAVFSEFHGRIAGVIMECIHGKLPTFQEEIDFAIGVRQLCKRYNILFISNEIRMGSGKTGKFLCSDWLGLENKPDMITLGKSITGGAFPASYVLGYNEAMSLVGSFQTGGTFTMAPAAVAATMAALKIYDEEKLTEKALIIEDKWKKATSQWNYPWVKYVTSRGADMSIAMEPKYGTVTPRRIARLAWQKGLFIYPTKAAIRVHIALTITDEELEKGLKILTTVMDEIESYGDIPGSTHPSDDDKHGGY
ncbi:Ornithine aminotransferase car2 [Colletotrichum gloeosporioides]|uniref:Ornithine aminotransferase n=1 Tax=Colletotrichum gloeosporioides TaxID=474922 RepID=A0A8H4CPX5_COLGL|nr:Ornithine aminotransferase car2 [Colletotrichum gloeosporioides]KAF3807970.1 Ornithine aminotransferase car2 [Colletotrichum gloeosporioides]